MIGIRKTKIMKPPETNLSQCYDLVNEGWSSDTERNQLWPTNPFFVYAFLTMHARGDRTSGSVSNYVQFMYFRGLPGALHQPAFMYAHSIHARNRRVLSSSIHICTYTHNVFGNLRVTSAYAEHL